jgi:hypothetical protein
LREGGREGGKIKIKKQLAKIKIKKQLAVGRRG